MHYIALFHDTVLRRNTWPGRTNSIGDGNREGAFIGNIIFVNHCRSSNELSKERYQAAECRLTTSSWRQISSSVRPLVSIPIVSTISAATAKLVAPSVNTPVAP